MRRWALGLFLAILFAVVFLIGLTTRGATPARTAEGTTIGGLIASDMDRGQLLSALEQAGKQTPSQVTVTLGERSQVVTAADFGINVDASATVDKALAESGSSRRWWFFGRTQGKDVAPVLVEDDPVAARLRERLVRVADVPESHGGVKAAAGTIIAVPPAAGQSLDPSVVGSALRDSLGRLPWPPAITVPVTVLPAHVTPEAVEALVAQARTQLTDPPRLITADRSFGPLTTLGAHLDIAPLGTTAGHGIELRLKASARDAIAVPAAEELSIDPQEPKVSAPAATALLREQGTVTWRPRPASVSVVAEGKPGQAVTADAVLQTLTAHLRSTTPAAEITAPAKTEQPKATTESVRRIDAVLGSFTTPFQCCPARVHNIRLITKTIDGTVIGPGQQFSLNGIVGPRTAAKGYREAPFILDGELSKDIGGGVSQFATTALNAAFFAGLKLDRYQPHSFYISRYPAGREATVNFPGIDLRWTNNTGAAVLVRAATTDNSLTVTLYGENDKRVVSGVSGPRVPVSGKDFRITITRTVEVPGRKPVTSRFTTTYNKPPEEH